jgi:nucleolar protein 56
MDSILADMDVDEPEDSDVEMGDEEKPKKAKKEKETKDKEDKKEKKEKKDKKDKKSKEEKKRKRDSEVGSSKKKSKA